MYYFVQPVQIILAREMPNPIQPLKSFGIRVIKKIKMFPVQHQAISIKHGM